jgi:hypothetical protein
MTSPAATLQSFQQTTAQATKPTKVFASMVQFDGPKVKSGITLEVEFLDDGTGSGTGKVVYPGNSSVLSGQFKSVSPGTISELKNLDTQAIKKLGLTGDAPWTTAVFFGSDTVLECVFGTTMPLNQKKGTCKDNHGNQYHLVF